MTLRNVWRGIRTGVLATAVMCAGSLVVTTGCSEKCDKCGSAPCEKKCDKPCPEGKKAEKHEHKEKAEK